MASHSEIVSLALAHSCKLFLNLWTRLHISASWLTLPHHWAWKELGKDGKWLSVRPWTGQQFCEKCRSPESESGQLHFSINKKTHHHLLVVGPSLPTGHPKYFQWPSSDLLSQKWFKYLMSYEGTSLGSENRKYSLSSNKHFVSWCIQRECSRMTPWTKMKGLHSVTPPPPDFFHSDTFYMRALSVTSLLAISWDPYGQILLFRAPGIFWFFFF